MEDAQVKRDESPIIICDASVLIDYIKSEPRVLLLTSKNIGRLHTPAQVLGEVKQLDSKTAKRLGIVIIQPVLSQLKEASIRGGPLSRSDKLVFIMSRDAGCTCWTSDHSLRKRCLDEGLNVLWGLEMLIILCEKGHLSKIGATRVARLVRSSGAFITDEVIANFEAKINKINKR